MKRPFAFFFLRRRARNRDGFSFAAWLVLALCCGATRAQPARAQDALVPAETYRARLEKTQAQLRRMEAAPTRPLKKVLQPLLPDSTLQRSDGATQKIGNDDLRRLLAQVSAKRATAEEVRAARELLATRQKALAQWMQPRDGQFYESADAQNIIKQLESSGQIRTGPTSWQQFWANVSQSLSDAFDKFVRWVGSLFPTPKTSPKVPNINPQLVRALFYICVLALLGLVLWLLWRALDGSWKFGKSSASARHWEGEDAELLLLPPDELRERAARFAAAGNFREALRHLYISLLLRLDARGIWRYDTRRTNWEHIAALRGPQSTCSAAFVQQLGDITRRFDRVRYGNADCSHDDWTRFESDVNTLEKTAPAASTSVAAKGAAS